MELYSDMWNDLDDDELVSVDDELKGLSGNNPSTPPLSPHWPYPHTHTPAPHRAREQPAEPIEALLIGQRGGLIFYEDEQGSLTPIETRYPATGYGPSLLRGEEETPGPLDEMFNG